jgi:hypothetical protein
MEIRILYNLQAVMNAWPYISKDVKKVQEFCHRDTNIDMVFNDIMSGNALLWLGFKENKYCGFLVTKFLTAPMGDKTLLVYQAYAKNELEVVEFAQTVEALFDFARDQKCNTVDFYTVRDKAFERKLKTYGWTPKYTVFSKEVGNVNGTASTADTAGDA